MNTLDAIAAFFTQIFYMMDSLIVPGFNFSFWELAAGAFLFVICISVFRFLLGFGASGLGQGFHKNHKKRGGNDE